MIKIDKKLEILRGYSIEGKAIKQLAREFTVSKNTVKRYIREFESSKNTLATEKVKIDKSKLIELMVEKPKYNASNRIAKVMTGVIIDKLKGFITENERKKSIGIKKQCMNSKSMHEALLKDGHKVSYTAVNNCVNKLEKNGKEAFIKQIYKHGDVCEFDWGEVKLEIAGKLTTYRLAAFTSAKGNYRYAVLYRKEQMQHFLDSHVKFFNHIGGVYKTIVYDNMRVAVARFVGKHEKEATDDLKKISLYYGFNYRFCNVSRGNEKGHVEKSVEYIRQKAFTYNIKFNSDEEANIHLLKVLDKLNAEAKNYMDNKTPADVLAEELPHMHPLLPSYDVADVRELRVDKYSTIMVDSNRYSVTDSLVGKFITAKVYTDKVRCYYDKNQVAVHERKYGSHEWTLTIEHYKKTLLRKPGALSGSLAFAQLSKELKNIFIEYYKDTPRDFIHLIELISEKGLEEVLKAINKLKQKHIAISTEHIKVLVNNTIDYNIINHKKVNDEIEENSRNALTQYGRILDFNNYSKEVVNG